MQIHGPRGTFPVPPGEKNGIFATLVRPSLAKADLNLLEAISEMAGTIFETLGPTGFDSETNGDVSMPSAGIQLVNLMTQPF